MEYNILLPTTIWQGYNPYEDGFEEETLGESFAENIKTTAYSFTALTSDDEKLKVVLKKTICDGETKGNILIVPEYHRPPQESLIKALAESGYAIFVVDISGVGEPKTTFPSAYAYGEYKNAGEHLYKVTSSAKDTCQYLYTLIVKRTLAFMSTVLDVRSPLLCGLGDAVEVAVQVAGTGSKIRALAGINGSGYKEYIKLNKYGTDKELELTEERMSWLSGVASVAYAKNVTVPTYFVFGTNSKLCDMDRLENLKELMKDTNVRLTLSPGAGEYVDNDGFIAFKRWLHSIFCEEYMPFLPEITLKINEDNLPTAEVSCDACSIIDSVDIFFSFGEYNRVLRKWDKKSGITISAGSYIGIPPVFGGEGPLFAFANVKYASGLTISSLPAIKELEGLSLTAKERKLSRIVYEPFADNNMNDSIEDYDQTVLFENGKSIVKTPSGTMGITSNSAGLKTYNIGFGGKAFPDAILQIDLYTDNARDITFKVETASDDGIKTYVSAIQTVATQDCFKQYQLTPQDFKDDEYLPLPSWSNAKTLTVYGKNVVIGNILFI